jgi:hypothetical protein
MPSLIVRLVPFLYHFISPFIRAIIAVALPAFHL